MYISVPGEKHYAEYRYQPGQALSEVPAAPALLLKRAEGTRHAKNPKMC